MHKLGDLRQQLETGGEIRRSTLVLAAWSRFLEGRTENGDPTPINDRRATELIAAAHAEHVEPGSFLDYRPVFGDLGTNTRLRERLGENGRQYVRQNHRWEAVLSRFDRLVSKIRGR